MITKASAALFDCRSPEAMQEAIDKLEALQERQVKLGFKTEIIEAKVATATQGQGQGDSVYAEFCDSFTVASHGWAVEICL